jgi:Magnesium chelatase, subunit ChlI
MLARRLTTILPAMSLAESLERIRAHSIASTAGRTSIIAARLSCPRVHTVSDKIRIRDYWHTTGLSAAQIHGHVVSYWGTPPAS